MSNSIENIFGLRLKSARKMAGFSLQDLADLLDNRVTKQALSKYEMGLMRPTGEVLRLLSKVLKVTPEYLIAESTVKIEDVAFRKRLALAKKDEEALIEKAKDYLSRYKEIEAILAIETVFINPIGDIEVKDLKGAADLAGILRKNWNLGDSPLANVIDLLELKGVKVLLIDAPEEIDGFAAYTTDGVPLIVINPLGKSVERIRFTVIHELAHLLLKINSNIPEKETEKICHCFSSNFLLPTQPLVQMMGGKKRTYINIKELEAIKEYYGISIRAILHRLEQIGIISKTYYTKWVVYLTKTYGPKNEPGTFRTSEKSQMLDLLVSRAFSEELISLSKAAALMNTSINEFKKGVISAE